MRVFISWSGSKSEQVALALREWLPGVINHVEPFVSSEDIYAGLRWQGEIASMLDASNFGIVCVTGENQMSSWLNFEAGALAKAVDVSRVIPLAIDLKPSDVELPLGQFQAKPATREGLSDVIVSLNEALGESKLPDELLRTSFDVWWPRLEEKLQEIEREATSDTPPPRKDRELLEETLDTVRSLARMVDQLAYGTVSGQDWLRRETLRRALDALPERERRIIVLRYGLDGDPPQTLDFIARQYGLTRERVRQIEAQALMKLTALGLSDDPAAEA